MIRRVLEERTARLRAIGLREALSIDPSTWRRMLKSTVAGTVAWEAAALIHSPRPVLASLGAVLRHGPRRGGGTLRASAHRLVVGFRSLGLAVEHSLEICRVVHAELGAYTV